MASKWSTRPTRKRNRVCCVLVDGREAGRAEFGLKLVVTEADMTAVAAREAIEFVDRLVLSSGRLGV
jgi:hypothetical protein